MRREGPWAKYPAGAVSSNTLVIVNPKSRGGKRRRVWSAVERALRERIPGFELQYTQGPRDAGRLAREGVASGADRIVVAGGDGTASEVASGLLSAALGHAAEIGFLPLGTGRDLARGLGLTRGLRRAIDAIAGGRTRQVDAGKVEYRSAAGAARDAYFVNVGSVGLSAAIVDGVGSGAKALWGQVAFAAGFAKTLCTWRPAPLEVRVDGEPLLRENLDLVAVANGNFFGGGMKLAPEARLDDGLFDVVAVRAMSRASWLLRMPRVYGGHHTRLDDVVVRRAREVEVRPLADSTAAPSVELDGEPTGRAPVRFQVLPGALRVLVPEA